MFYWLFFVLESIFLFLTSKILFNSLFFLFHKICKSQKISVSLLSLIFFPGVLVHEISHLITAELLFVKTFEVELVPKIHDGRIQMGSVKVRETDFLRRFLIGVAPFFWGSTILFILLFYFSKVVINDIFSNMPSLVIAVIIFWAVFAISNTMFSSKKDLEGVVVIIFLAFVLLLTFFIAGIDVFGYSVKFLTSQSMLEFAKKWDYLMLFPVLINLFVVVVSLFFFKNLRKLR